jgi:class 3 adenylate cyclase
MGNHPAAKAGGFVTELLRQRPGFPWRIGMDFGECLFCWSPLSGYTAFGSPVIRSRILAGLCPRYKARVLVSEPVRERISVPVRKLSVLAGSGEKSVFYELVIHSGAPFPGA